MGIQTLRNPLRTAFYHPLEIKGAAAWMPLVDRLISIPLPGSPFPCYKVKENKFHPTFRTHFWLDHLEYGGEDWMPGGSHFPGIPYLRQGRPHLRSPHKTHLPLVCSRASPKTQSDLFYSVISG